MISIGLIGLSPGNGHPYSWGSIFNGYDTKVLQESEWDVIYQYVKLRDFSEFGFPNIRITHVWTQDRELSENLRASIKADYVVENYCDLLDKVDGIIIARDDFENHYEMSKLFLDAGKKVLVDKPLTLNMEELMYFKAFLENGQLMSVAALRFAKELDFIRGNIDKLGGIKTIQTAVIMDWEKYGIHMIDGVLSFINEIPISINYIKGSTELFIVKFANGLIWTINILGKSVKTFNIQIWGEEDRFNIEIEDNFSMFRRLLFRYTKLVNENKILHNPNDTLLAVGLLIAGKQSKDESREVYLSEIYNQLGLV